VAREQPRSDQLVEIEVLQNHLAAEFRYFKISRSVDEAGERCSDGGVGKALSHQHDPSTIAECDHLPILVCVSLTLSQVASQGTGAVNVRNTDMTMY
jgi:hypothetical protein